MDGHCLQKNTWLMLELSHPLKKKTSEKSLGIILFAGLGTNEIETTPRPSSYTRTWRMITGEKKHVQSDGFGP